MGCSRLQHGQPVPFFYEGTATKVVMGWQECSPQHAEHMTGNDLANDCRKKADIYILWSSDWDRKDNWTISAGRMAQEERERRAKIKRLWGKASSPTAAIRHKMDICTRATVTTKITCLSITLSISLYILYQIFFSRIWINNLLRQMIKAHCWLAGSENQTV